jgi:hypothetical protein
MKQTSEEMHSRVVQMILDDGSTWDLSPNDKDALHYVIGLVDVLARKLADHHGTTIPLEISWASKCVQPLVAKREGK